MLVYKMFVIVRKILDDVLVWLGKVKCYNSCCSNINIKITEPEIQNKSPKKTTSPKSNISPRRRNGSK